MPKYVYNFSEGSAELKSLLGGKGAGLAEMARISIPVPLGFTITTQACNDYISNRHTFPEGLLDQVESALDQLEKQMGKSLGAATNPLLVSVRSGAVISMPGMMDTILNLGLNDRSVVALAEASNNERFAWDSYRRFIQMYGDIVLGIDHNYFENSIAKLKDSKKITNDTDLDVSDLMELVSVYKEIIDKQGQSFPKDSREQLYKAIEAVFNSWDNPRAVTYRRHNEIPNDLGTAVNIQSMVFGNMGNTSATGVGFTRNPSNGKKELYGEYLINAQGEDVVAGIRTPKELSNLKNDIPDAFDQLIKTMSILENHYRQAQDIEFTIQEGKLYLLQTRTAKTTSAASLKIARDMVEEGLISKQEAILRLDPKALSQLLHPMVDPKAKIDVLATGLAASPGAGQGKVIFDADEAVEMAKSGEKVILVRWETTPDDIHGVIASQGVLTVHGGMTSHAAVVARGMGKPAVTGCNQISLNSKLGQFQVGEVIVRQGDEITVDGTTGQIILGHVDLVEPDISQDFQLVMSWADQIRTLGVRANADNAQDAAKAVEYGAEGIGLCRTEHMFMETDRLPYVQDAIVSDDKKTIDQALSAIEKMQKQDFKEIFTQMGSLPVTIRLLDPPLHEFLPSVDELNEQIEDLDAQGVSEDELKQKKEILARVLSFQEANPMLGARGVRLGIIRPDLYILQTRAIIQAALEVKEQTKIEPMVEIMIPLVGFETELQISKDLILQVADEVFKQYGQSIEFKIGTMIEVPRACVVADKIAPLADFFSFGTNDLTQMTLGFSRDDAEGKFIPQYLEKSILEKNPFETIDVEGVGQLMKMARDRARSVNPDLKLGICGEHGGDPASIKFANNVVDYVSCSPFRVPLARLAAAQAALENKEGFNL